MAPQNRQKFRSLLSASGVSTIMGPYTPKVKGLWSPASSVLFVSLLSTTNVDVFLSFPESKLSQGAVERRNQHWNRNWYGNPGWWRTDSDSGEEWLGSTLISRSVFCRILKNDAKKIVAQRCQTKLTMYRMFHFWVVQPPPWTWWLRIARKWGNSRSPWHGSHDWRHGSHDWWHGSHDWFKGAKWWTTTWNLTKDLIANMRCFSFTMDGLPKLAGRSSDKNACVDWWNKSTVPCPFRCERFLFFLSCGRGLEGVGSLQLLHFRAQKANEIRAFKDPKYVSIISTGTNRGIGFGG